jgi:hypothetical protein
VRRSFTILCVAAALAAPTAIAQTRDADELEGLIVLQVDPTRNEIRVQDPGSTRIRTIELDERTRITGGALGGPVDMRTLQPGDTIRVPGALGSVSDRVQADEITVLTTPRAPGAAPGGMGVEPREGFERGPSALQPEGGSALGSDRPLDPSALGRDPQAPSALGRDPQAPSALEPGDAGMTGADPGATDQDTRGTGSSAQPRTGLGTRGNADSRTRSGTSTGAGSSGRGSGTSGSSGTSGTSGSGSSGGGSSGSGSGGSGGGP